MVRHGLGRRGSGGRRRRPRPRHDPIELGGHGDPDDPEQLVTSGPDFFPARQAGTLSFRPSGHPAPPPGQGAPLAGDLPMAFVARRLPLHPAVASQSGRLGRAIQGKPRAMAGSGASDARPLPPFASTVQVGLISMQRFADGVRETEARRGNRQRWMPR